MYKLASHILEKKKLYFFHTHELERIIFIFMLRLKLRKYTLRCVWCCDVVVAQINYPSLKHNIQNSIEQARGRSHEEGSSQIFMLDDMQFRGGVDVI